METNEKETRKLSKVQIIERSIMKRFRKEIWTRFTLALKRYSLVEEGDKIAVCVSGGKDSMLLAVLMKLLKRYSKVNFEVVYLSMDPGYSEKNLDKIMGNAQILELPLTIFNSNIFDYVAEVDGSPCYICARMRRGHLYHEAQKLGCNKIALAHHFNDVIETTLMGMLYGAQIQAMPPKLVSKNFEGMELIRPLYCVHEKDIIAWARYNDLSFINCACRLTERSAVDDNASARRKIKRLIEKLEEDIPEVDEHIFKSVHNCNFNTMVGGKFFDKDIDFNEIFENNKKNAKK